MSRNQATVATQANAETLPKPDTEKKYSDSTKWDKSWMYNWFHLNEVHKQEAILGKEGREQEVTGVRVKRPVMLHLVIDLWARTHT